MLKGTTNTWSLPQNYSAKYSIFYLWKKLSSKFFQGLLLTSFRSCVRRVKTLRKMRRLTASFADRSDSKSTLSWRDSKIMWIRITISLTTFTIYFTWEGRGPLTMGYSRTTFGSLGKRKRTSGYRTAPVCSSNKKAGSNPQKTDAIFSLSMSSFSRKRCKNSKR